MELKQYLKINNLTSKKFAELIGVNEISISRYINGTRFPNKKILKKICDLTHSSINPEDFLKKKYKKKSLSTRQEAEINMFVKEIENGSRLFLAKAITLIESNLSIDQIKAEKLLSLLTNKKKKSAFRIGVTGVPGVGKSTFIEAIGIYLIKKGFKVGVLAVDPSSKVAGGSILGDKTRMERLSVEKNAFIRPSPSGDQLGGVTKKTRESIICLEYANYDVIFVETMGVGQAETAVYNMVDIFLVLLIPSGGDDLQGIKKGIIELADLLIVNKSDTILEDAANTTLLDYKNALSIIKPIREDFKPVILSCSSKNFVGIPDVWEKISFFFKIRKKNKSFYKNRLSQNREYLIELTQNKILDLLKKQIKEKKLNQLILKKMNKGSINIIEASNLLLTSFVKKI